MIIHGLFLPFSAPVFSLLKGWKRSALTQKGFEDFQNQGPCIFSPTSTYPKLRYPAQGFVRESSLIVLHLASCQLCHMMIKCFYPKSSEKLKLFFEKQKVLSGFIHNLSPDNDQLFLPLDRHPYRDQMQGRDTDLKPRSTTEHLCLYQAPQHSVI